MKPTGAALDPLPKLQSLGFCFTVDDATLMTGYSRRSILAAIHSGELEAVEHIYYRHRPTDGLRLRRRFYAIPDWSIRAFIESKIVRRQSDGGWRRKPGPKPQRTALGRRAEGKRDAAEVPRADTATRQASAALGPGWLTRAWRTAQASLGAEQEGG